MLTEGHAHVGILMATLGDGASRALSQAGRREQPRARLPQPYSFLPSAPEREGTLRSVVASSN